MWRLKFHKVPISQHEEVETEPVILSDVDLDIRGKVILYNDDWHTFDEVIEQIIKATGYSYARAEAITWEVHTRGKAKVYEGPIEDCIRVSAILEEIHLKTEIVC